MNYLPQTIKYKIEVYFSDEGKHDLTMHNMKAAFPLASLPYNRKSDIKASETEDVLGTCLTTHESYLYDNTRFSVSHETTHHASQDHCVRARECQISLDPTLEKASRYDLQAERY